MIKRKIDNNTYCEIAITHNELRVSFYSGWWIFASHIHTHRCLLPRGLPDEVILFNVEYAIKQFKLLRGDALDGE